MMALRRYGNRGAGRCMHSEIMNVEWGTGSREYVCRNGKDKQRNVRVTGKSQAGETG